MKIAINTRFLLKHQMEGVGRFIYETTKRLVLNHPDDEFHFLFDRSYDPSFIHAPNVKAKVLFPPARSPWLWKYWFEIAVPQYLKKIKADVFFSPDTYLSLSSKVPCLLVSHDIAYAHFPEHIPKPALKYYQKYFPKYHKRANKIIAVSSFTKKDIIETYGVDESKIQVAYNAAGDNFKKLNGVEKEEIRKDFTGGKPYFIYVGSIHPRKNIQRLILAFNRFKSQTKSDIKLILVGRLAWKIDSILACHKESSYTADIIFLQHIDQGIEKLMGAAEALVYVSLHEGFGIPVLEAMHCDIPVICSNSTSLPEVAGKAAILVNPNNTIEISDAMIRIVKDLSLRKQIIEAGQLQRKKFDWDKTSEIIYQQLAFLAKS
jgi:glycosyltransferase involved in cell wall biosynthesis